MGILTILDSKSSKHRSWREIVRLVVYIVRRRLFNVER
jgi:hypothetical protein